MKIDPLTSQPLVKKSEVNQERAKPERNAAEDSTDTSAAVTADRVNISSNSRLYQRALELATLAPDVRSEKVADLTARIAAGTYKVSSETVATSMIRKSVSEFV
ncbi:MAG: flagellar biosynthesis anti-sigma factor FlgM [Deltaproteobacteria bacterium]|jgi:negative regulator of flagellin synthesis FlgM|nr:flagellar biosynthesis anti-sigma factor FlgM [Deltaproteobacteria bacterium]